MRPSSEEIALKKERKIASRTIASTNFGYELEARKERAAELKMMADLESDPRLKKTRIATLFTFLETDPPKLQVYDTSGKFTVIIILTCNSNGAACLPAQLFFSENQSESLVICTSLIKIG